MSSGNYKKGRRKMSEKIKMFLFATVLATAFSIIIANSFAAEPVLAVKTSTSHKSKSASYIIIRFNK